VERGIVALVSFGAAFAMSWLVQPHFRNLGFLTKIVDHPGGRRPHLETVPRTGGLAIFISFFCSLYFLETTVLKTALPWPWLGILGGAGLVILALGVGDDRFGIHAEKKLYGQLVVILGLMLAGQRLDNVSLPLVGTFALGGWSWPFTLLWYLGFINSMNLIDGLDGLASGIAVLASLFLVAISLSLGSGYPLLLAASLAGGTMAFLYWNISSRKIFLGDSGSMWLGLALGTLMLHMSQVSAVPLPTLLAAMVVPIWDTATTIVRRCRNRTSIFLADDNHLHHRLVRLGFSPARAVIVLLLVTAGSQLFALSDFLRQPWLGLPAMGAYLVAAQLGALQHLSNRRFGWDLFSELFYALGLDDRLGGHSGLHGRRVAEVVELHADRQKSAVTARAMAAGGAEVVPHPASSPPRRKSVAGAADDALLPTSHDVS